MIVPKINVDVQSIEAIDKAFESIEARPIAICNWPEKASYVPEVSFKMFHTGAYWVLRYDVREDCTRAFAAKDNDPVCQDSCVECFVSTDDGKHYYNFETSCNGKMHVAWRATGEHGGYATEEQLSLIKRYTTLPQTTFDEFKGDNVWHLTLVFPAEALYGDDIKTFDGLHTTMNLYKCGDKLSKPHYLSWAPITNGRVSFHQPQFFQRVDFE